jgi:hypothetical protein
MKPAEKIEEDGKKALAHSCAVQMMVCGMAERVYTMQEQFWLQRATWGLLCVLNRRGIASMGIPGPDGEKYHQGDWGSSDGAKKRKTEHWIPCWIHISKAFYH